MHLPSVDAEIKPRLSSYIFVGNKISTPSTNLSSYLKKPLQKKQIIMGKIEIFRTDIFAIFYPVPFLV